MPRRTKKQIERADEWTAAITAGEAWLTQAFTTGFDYGDPPSLMLAVSKAMPRNRGFGERYEPARFVVSDVVEYFRNVYEPADPCKLTSHDFPRYVEGFEAQRAGKRVDVEEVERMYHANVPRPGRDTPAMARRRGWLLSVLVWAGPRQDRGRALP